MALTDEELDLEDATPTAPTAAPTPAPTPVAAEIRDTAPLSDEDLDLVEETVSDEELDLVDIPKDVIKIPDDYAGASLRAPTEGELKTQVSPDRQLNWFLNDDVQDTVRQARRSTYGSEANVASQFVSSFLNPTAELVAGSMALATGDVSYLDAAKSEAKDVPFEVLDPLEKVAVIGGTALGYIMPGSGIKKLAETTIAGAVKALGAKTMVQTAQKTATKFVQKGLVSKLPGELTRNLAGQYAGKILKTGPVLAMEGAIWEGLASGGDAEHAALGALGFATLGPLAEIAIPALARGTGKLVAKTSQAVGKTVDVVGGGGTTGGVKAIEKATRPESMVRELNDQTATAVKKYVTKNKDYMDVMLDPIAPEGVTDLVWLKGKAHITAMTKAKDDAYKLTRSSQLEKNIGNRTRKIESINNKVTKIEEYLAKTAPAEKALKETVVKEKDLVLPKKTHELKSSFNTKMHLNEAFGRDLSAITQIAQSGDEAIIAKTLIDSGLSKTASISVAKQLTGGIEKLVTKSPGKIKALGKKIGKAEIKQSKMRSKIKSLGKQRDKLNSEILDYKSHPMYIEGAAEVVKKSGATTRNTLAESLYNEELQKAGMKDVLFDLPMMNTTGKNLLNMTEWGNRIQESTGVPIGQPIWGLIGGVNKKQGMLKALKNTGYEDSLKSLQKDKVSGKQLWEWMHYVQQDLESGVIKWNSKPGKVGKATEVPEFTGNMPSTSQMNSMFKLRDTLTRARGMVVGAGEDVGFHPGYVGTKSKFPGVSPNKFGPKKVKKQGLLQEKVWGMVPEEFQSFYETDMYKLYPRMVTDSANAAAFSKPIEQAMSAAWMLRAMGAEGTANKFIEYTKRAMGHRNNEDLRTFTAEKFISSTPEWRESFTKMVEDNGGVAEEAISSAYGWMYHSLIGINPGILLKQFMQPAMVGSAELSVGKIPGAKFIGQGYLKAYGGNLARSKGALGKNMTKAGSEDLAALERNWDELIPEKVDFVDLTETTRKWLKTVNNVMELPGKPGMAAFTKLDQKNRIVSFFGARDQFTYAADKGKLKEIFSVLLDSERSVIADAYQRGGKEVAKDTYGMIMAKRHNFAYSMAEKSEMLSSKLGRYIPFTTWGANQWMRHIENVRGKNFSALGARFGYAYAGVGAMQMLLGEKFYPSKIGLKQMNIGEMSSALPQSSMMGVFGPEVSPNALVNTIGPGHAIPAVRAYKKGAKWAKKFGFVEDEKGKGKIGGKVKIGGKKKSRFEVPAIVEFKSPFTKKKDTTRKKLAPGIYVDMPKSKRDKRFK